MSAESSGGGLRAAAAGPAPLRSIYDARREAVPAALTRGQVREIALASMSDVVRNDNITLAYYILSNQMADNLGDQVNGNWCTFGVWGSSSAGTGIRTSSLPTRLASGLRSMPAPAAVRDSITGRLIKVRSSGARHPSRLLAAGNRGVFFEMAHAYVAFFELFGEARSPERERRLLDEFLRRIPELPPLLGKAWPRVDRGHVLQGFHAYLQARRATDPHHRAQLMLLANLRLAEYEQRRLQTWLTLAVSEPRLRLAESRNTSPNPSARAEHAWLQFVTHRLLAVDLGGETLPVDRDLRAPKGQAFVPSDLRTIDVPELRELLQRLDPIHLDAPLDWNGEGTAVTNWVDIDQRMRFVAALFRSRLQSRQVWNAPFPDTDVAAVAAGRDPHRLASSRVERRSASSADNERWSHGRLDDLRLRADPLVDGVVDAYWQQCRVSPEHRRFDVLMRELRSVGRAPHPVIADYLAHNVDRPAWADNNRIAAGQRFYRELRLPINLALLIGSLPEAYGAAKGVEVLETVSALVTDPKRRIGQTAQFVLDVTLADPLEPMSLADKSIKGVRLMHAAARHMIEVGGYGLPDGADRPPSWDPDLGVPINQEDLLGTMLSFAVPPLDFLERTGLLIDERAAEHYLHLWCVVGARLGLEPALLADPTDPDRTLTVAQARDLAAVIRSRHHRPSYAGQHLMSALHAELVRHTPRGLRGFPSALIRFSIGDDLADALQVPPRGMSDFVLDRAVRFGGGLRSDRWFRWALPRLIEVLGDQWYRVFAEGGHAADPSFRDGFRLTAPAGRERERVVSRSRQGTTIASETTP